MARRLQPFRLDRTQAVRPAQTHDYTAEQLAFDPGLMDLFALVGCQFGLKMQ